MVKRLSIWLSVFLVLNLVLIQIFSAVAWAKDEKSLGMGLIEPTPEQVEWIQKNIPVIQKIRLNQVALERINAERLNKGLGRLSERDLDIAPMGKEAVFSSTDPLTETTGDTVSALVGVLPGSVDNSTSPAFPPIRSQGSIGSCAAWSTTYYQLTYETNFARGRTASSGDNNVIFSPKWTYNMINRGVDAGSSFADAYALEMKNGAASWADFPYDSNYLTWSMDPSTWNEAISYRTQSWGQISTSNPDTLISNIKTQLANGHVIVIGTYVLSWVQKRVGNDLSTTADDAFNGQYIASYSKNTRQGGHGMTVVGYNDDIWCDLNGNNVVDTGEKGALKIANSWGTGDWNKGFRWVTYDALRTTSQAPSSTSWPTTDRASGGMFMSNNVFTLATSPSYTPTYKAEITVNHLKRGQLAITLGTGSTTSITPSATWSSKAVYKMGGNYSFNGTTTSVDGTFYFDFTDLAKSVSGPKRWFVGVNDSTSGSTATIKSFKLYRSTASGDVLVATSSNAPKSVDAGQAYVWVDYTPGTTNQPPSAIINASPLSGLAPLTVNFNGSSSQDTDGSITSYAWNFGDSTSATGPSTSHQYNSAGTFIATLTVTDNNGATGSSNVSINVTSASNRTPVLTTIGNKTVNENSLLQFTVTASDLDGDPLTFSATNLPSGSTFNTSTHVFSWTPGLGQAAAYSGVHFQVTDGKSIDSEDITITVNAVTPTTGQISGVVKDTATGLAINGATVSAGTRSAITNSSGSYTISSMSAGTYSVTANATGYQTISSTVTVTAGQTSTANFSLQKVAPSNSMWVESITYTPSGSYLYIKLKVVNPQPVANALVSVRVYFGSYSATATKATDANGEATFRVYPANNGTYTTTVTGLSLSGYTWDTTKGVKSVTYSLSR